MAVPVLAKAVAFLAVAPIAASVFPVVLHTQPYPVKPIRILAGFTPGAGVDIAMRLLAPKMADALGRQIVIDIRSGAGRHAEVAKWGKVVKASGARGD